MAQPYLDRLQQLIRDVESDRYNLACKHFFSGAALYVDGYICASLTPKGLAFKLSESRCDNLIAEKVAVPMQYFDDAPFKRGYVLFPEFESLGIKDIREYFEECIRHCVG